MSTSTNYVLNERAKTRIEQCQVKKTILSTRNYCICTNVSQTLKLEKALSDKKNPGPTASESFHF